MSHNLRVMHDLFSQRLPSSNLKRCSIGQGLENSLAKQLHSSEEKGEEEEEEVTGVNIATGSNSSQSLVGLIEFDARLSVVRVSRSSVTNSNRVSIRTLFTVGRSLDSNFDGFSNPGSLLSRFYGTLASTGRINLWTTSNLRPFRYGGSGWKYYAEIVSCQRVRLVVTSRITRIFVIGQADGVASK